MNKEINALDLAKAIGSCVLGAALALTGAYIGYELGCRDTWRVMNQHCPEAVNKCMEVVAQGIVMASKQKIGLA